MLKAILDNVVSNEEIVQKIVVLYMLNTSSSLWTSSKVFTKERQLGILVDVITPYLYYTYTTYPSDCNGNCRCKPVKNRLWAFVPVLLAANEPDTKR